jgi:hypothetical protein
MYMFKKSVTFVCVMRHLSTTFERESKSLSVKLIQMLLIR